MPFSRLVQNRIKSGSGQAEVKAVLANEGMKISTQALLTLFGDDLDMIENWEDVEDLKSIGKNKAAKGAEELWIDDLVDTLYTLYKDGEIVVRWVGDKISHEPLPATEGKGQDYCQISPCPWPPWG